MPMKTMKRGEGLPQMTLRPVGIVKSKIKEPSLLIRCGDLHRRGVLEDAMKERSTISEILISDDFNGILDGIEEFSHILVLYWSHFTSKGDRSLINGHPMGRKDLPEVGILLPVALCALTPFVCQLFHCLKEMGM